MNHVTCYLNEARGRRAIRVDGFGVVPAAPVSAPARRGARRAVVRVTHASVGATDVAAIRGDYLLQPFPRLTPGYDLVGVVEHLPAGAPSHLSVGQRVAAVLPRMGAHATRVSLAPSLLVPVPDGLASAVAATVPLDGVTARLALDALPLDARRGGSVLVQGAGGAVGSWAVQLAGADGREVYGTASLRSRRHAEGLGATVLDYDDPHWVEHLRDLTGGGVAGAVDQTGGRGVRDAVAHRGRLVRIAFGGAPGHQRRATATGVVTTLARRYADPRELVCSVPLLVATRRAVYRRALADLLDAVAAGDLIAPLPSLHPVESYREAVADAASAAAGTKTVLELED